MSEATRLVRSGARLTALGLLAYGVTGRQSKTALIPTFVGAPMLGLGVVSLIPAVPRPIPVAGHVLAAVGLVGSIGGVSDLPALAAGEAKRPAATVTRAIMATFCARHLLSTFFDRS